MANDNLMSSFRIERITEPEVSWLGAVADLLEKLAQEDASEEDEATLRKQMDWTDLKTTHWGWDFQYGADDPPQEDGTIHGWIMFFTEESGDLEMMAELMQRFLLCFRPKEHIIFTWAETCDKPRPDHFSGGSMLVTATDTRVMDARRWAEEELERVAHRSTQKVIPAMGRSELIEELEALRDGACACHPYRVIRMEASDIQEIDYQHFTDPNGG
jgi:hypothetical protein